MACPFLNEGRARYCHAATSRKLILEGPGSAGGGRCDSPAYRECPLVAPGEHGERCPHLEEVHVQYCGAAPVVKLVPFSESQLSRCGGAGHRYCDLYLSMSHPRDPMHAPADLFYSPNHLWLDVNPEGSCHVGVDSFVAQAVGTVDRLTFLTSRGTHRPGVVLTIRGVEWPVVFPNPMIITEVNTHVRHDPGRLTADPYGSGWLFEGWEVPGRTREGLVRGPQSEAWMAEETERLSRFIHESFPIAGDGGYAAPGVVRLLSREDAVRLLQEFVAPNAAWVRER